MLGRRCCVFKVKARVSALETFLTVGRHRHHLEYHDWHQISWGLCIGSSLGFSMYLVCEFIPTRYPTSYLSQVKMFALDNPVSTWLQIRDGWAVWSDGGREVEWRHWRAEWEKQEKVGRLKKRAKYM
jgi:dolichyldiphosphatase